MTKRRSRSSFISVNEISNSLKKMKLSDIMLMYDKMHKDYDKKIISTNNKKIKRVLLRDYFYEILIHCNYILDDFNDEILKYVINAYTYILIHNQNPSYIKFLYDKGDSIRALSYSGVMEKYKLNHKAIQLIISYMTQKEISDDIKKRVYNIKFLEHDIKNLNKKILDKDYKEHDDHDDQGYCEMCGYYEIKSNFNLLKEYEDKLKHNKLIYKELLNTNTTNRKIKYNH